MNQSPIRVLHVFGALEAGGAQNRIMDIYRKIDKNKIQFDFVAQENTDSYFEEEIKNLGGQVYYVPKFNGKNIIKYQKAWRNIFRNNPNFNVIHGHQTTTAFIYMRIAKKFKIKKRIAHSRNAHKDTFVKTILSKLSRFYATDLYAVSKLAARSEFGKRLTHSRVKILPNAIDTSRFLFNQDNRTLKRQVFKIEDDVPVYLHIGRFHKQKNHDFLLELFKEIIIKKPSAKLLLVGDGERRNDITSKIESLDLKNSVLLLGLRDDVEDLYQCADCFLLPSYYEGLPGVLLEAQASDLPSIVSNAVTKEAIITERTNYLSLEKFDDWIKLALTLPFSYKRKNRINDFKEKNFDINSIVYEYENLYLN